MALLPGLRGKVPARFRGGVGDATAVVALVTDPNGDERRAQARITFPSGAGTSAPPVELEHHSGGGSSPTGPAIVAGMLAATALVGAVRTRQRRAARS
jgi:MYXO-CTERM domain-containing protein